MTANGPAPLSSIFCFFGAFFLFSCTDAGAKYLVLAGMQPPFLSWTRFLVHAVLVSLLLRLWVRPQRFAPANPGAHVLRGILLFLSGLFSFWSLITLQLVEFIAIIFMGPLVITALAQPLLGEKVEWQRWIAVGVGLIGVLVITRPGFGTFKAGHASALLAMLTHSLFVIMTRRMSASETHESLLILPAVVATVFMLPAVPLTGSLPANGLQWAVLLSLGAFAALGHWLFLRAYRTTEASVLAPYAYVQMLWTALFGYFLFGNIPDGWTMLGSAIIIAGGLYLMHRDRLARAQHR
jgi:drug/metabolite transporter (DMT)-like permease